MAATITNFHPLSLFSETDLCFNPTKLNFTRSSFITSPHSFPAIISHAHHQNTPPFSSSSKPKFKKTGVLDSPMKTQKLNLQVSPHRAVAAVRLMRIEFGGAFADLLNERGKGSGNNEMEYVERTLGFRTRDLEERDLRLVTDIVGGAIRWRKYLDYLILSLCHDEGSFRSMEPLLLQNVNLAKFALRPGAGNMVNGILRKLVSLKDKDSLPVPKLDGNDRAQARALATTHSHPVVVLLILFFSCFFICSLGTRANIAKGLTREDLVMKLNLLKVPHEPSLHLDDFVRVRRGMQTVIQNGFLKEGLCSVQDESAGLAVSVLDPQPDDCIIDCCAAPGGKTLFMASRLNGRGMISAIDINKGRLRILEETAKLQSVDGVINCIHADLRSFADSNKLKFNKVLLDAPCSGLGVLSKRPDLRWNRKLEDMEELKSLQDELLDAACKLVKPGGVLVYSTCSIDPEENEDRVFAFLIRHPEFQIDPVHSYVPPDFSTEQGFFCSCPVKHSMDGAFAARLIQSQ
uniref:SAM-dependent MTase RsmB/NOP-type domain-containing protein n=1 Tax=Chenopodium quinoa TaxID=63459 RepID=A0A803MWM5_CHEQI